MTVKDLRTLVDNLDEYIHVPGGIERLKKTILHLAVSGQLVPQDPSEENSKRLYDEVQAVRAKFKDRKSISTSVEISVPFAISPKLKWVRLGDVVDFKYGKGIDRQHRDKSFQYPFFGANGELDRVDKYLIESDGIIIGRKGSAGAVNLANGPFWPSDVTYYIEDEQFGAFDRKYLFYLLKSLNLESLANGIKPGLNRNEAYELYVILFPRKTQLRIVQRINELYDLIDKLANKYYSEQTERRRFVVSSLTKLAKCENSLALNELTEIIKTKADASELRITILHLALSGQLVPHDSREGTGQELYEQIQAEKQELIHEGKLKKQNILPEITEAETPFEIPKNWKWMRLGEIGQIVGGGTPPSAESEYYTENSNAGIPWITPADLRGYKNMYISSGKRNITAQGLKNCSTRLMPKDTILFSSRAPIGHIAIAGNEITTNQGFKSVIPYSGIDSEYVYRWLQFYGPTIDANASGTTFREVSGAIVTKQLIPVPPRMEQTRIVEKASALLALVDKLETHLEEK